MRGGTLPDRRRIVLEGSRFVVASSGVADGPSQALSRFLVERGAREVWVVSHPLVAEGEPEHHVHEMVSGRRRSFRRPNRPPLTFVFDPVTPLRLPEVDVWVGFNCLVTSQGLVRRRLRRVRRVVHWSVDFVPQRFGDSPLTRMYDRLDRWCITASDGRVELSAAAFRGRLEAYGLPPDAAPAEIVPMGSWLDETPSTTICALDAPRLVFLGHLVDRMGVPTVLDTVVDLRRRGVAVEADVIGGGPLLEPLRKRAAEIGVGDAVTFHGFVDDFSEVRRLLARGAIAVAPYEVDETSFSRFADPGKLKAYLAAGLPILLTPVPPNAAEIAAEGGATIVEPGSACFADAAAQLLADRGSWARRHQAALDYATRFDWDVLLAAALPRLGIDLDATRVT